MTQQVKDFMSKDCQWLPSDATAREAAELMRDQDIGFVPVGEKDKLIGMVTDRDIVLRCVAAGHDAEDCMVRDIMTKETYYCFDDQDVEEVCENMGDLQIRRLPVVNRDKRLVGVISMGDVAQAAAKAKVGAAEQQITAETAQKKAA